MEITPHTLKLIVREAAELGALNALIQAGKMKPYLKKSEAFHRYGRAKVEYWLQCGLITPRKDGDYSAAWRLDLLEMEVLSKSLHLLEEL